MSTTERIDEQILDELRRLGVRLDGEVRRWIELWEHGYRQIVICSIRENLNALDALLNERYELVQESWREKEECDENLR